MQVFLYDEQQYNDSRNEMIVRNGGARMHPEPKFLISGLNPDDVYQMKIRLELVDEYRYHWQQEQWTAVSPAGINAHLSRITQLESRKERGSTWHSTIIHFDNLRITKHLRDLGRHMIYVEPNHRYIPILSVIHVSSGAAFDVRFEKLQFMAVKLSSRNSPPSLTSSVRRFDSSDDESNEIIGSAHFPQQQQQHYSWPPVDYGVWQHFDYYQHLAAAPQQQHQQLHYAHLQYAPVAQLQYPQLQYPQQHVAPSQYVPEYGWNPILVPGLANQPVLKNCHLRDVLHEIWAPQKMELEKLYFLTEQNYQPLAMN